MMRMGGAMQMTMMMAGMFSRERGLREDRNGKRNKQEAHHDGSMLSSPSGAHLHRRMWQNRAVVVLMRLRPEPAANIGAWRRTSRHKLN
jgi:hypothetical protein